MDSENLDIPYETTQKIQILDKNELRSSAYMHSKV